MPGQTARLGNPQARLGLIRLGEGPAVPTISATLPQVLVEFSPSTDPMAAADWVDISDAAVTVSTSRGRNTARDRVEAGTLTLTLLSDDRRFDPTNTAGPYAGRLVPMKRIRVRAVWNGVVYPVFSGYVETWSTPVWRWGRIVCTVSAVDGFALLAMKKISGSYPQQRTDQRIDTILTDAGWSAGQGWLLGDATYGVLGTTTIPAPVGEKSLSMGQTTVQAQTLSNVSALTHLQLMAQAEQGLLFIGGSGAVTFRSRHELLYATTVLATFGYESGALPFADVHLDSTGAHIINEVRVTRIGGTEQVASDAASITSYFGRTLSISSLPLLTDTEALAFANFLLAGRSTFRFGPDGLTVEPMAAPTAVWPAVLGLELNDRISVVYRPSVGSEMDEDVQIQKIEHDWSGAVGGGPWATRFALAPNGLGTPGLAWLLGDATYGVLGTTTAPAY